MAAAASVLLGCLCVALLRHTSGNGVPTSATAAPDDLTAYIVPTIATTAPDDKTADIVTATAAATSGAASETTDTVSTTTDVPSIENLHGTTAIVEDAFSTEGASATVTRHMATTDAPEATVTFIADVTDATTTGSFSADPASAATTAKEQPPTATEESTGWQEASPSDQHSLDNVLDLVFDLVGNITDSTSRSCVTELKEHLGEQSAALRRDTQLAASSSETAVLLLAGRGGIQDTVQALQTRQTRTEAELGALRGDLTQLQTGQARAEAELGALRGDLTQLQTGQVRAEAERGALRGDLTQLKTGQTRAEAELGALRGDLTQLQTGQARVEAELGALREDLTQLQTEQSRLMRLLVSVHQYQLLTCPAGWSRHGTSCFIIHTQTAAWDQAERICQQMSSQAHLASVHPDTAQHVRQLAGADNPELWIGLRRHAQPPVWRWSDGTQVDHTDWLPGEPNNAWGKEDCVHASYRLNHPHGWNDGDCSHQLKFICQIREPPSP